MGWATIVHEPEVLYVKLELVQGIIDLTLVLFRKLKGPAGRPLLSPESSAICPSKFHQYS